MGDMVVVEEATEVAAVMVGVGVTKEAVDMEVEATEEVEEDMEEVTEDTVKMVATVVEEAPEATVDMVEVANKDTINQAIYLKPILIVFSNSETLLKSDSNITLIFGHFVRMKFVLLGCFLNLCK